MSTHTTDLRNRADPAAEDAIIAHLRDAERMAYAETRGPFEATPNPGNGLYLGGDDGEPASGGETAAVIGALICACLLLAGLAYLVWAGSHGGYPWTR